ncbi:hypothetical protein JM93_00762 [Roseibium hamelinense]|uniref:Uncharacterized protein n=1 Tax=Roseibium hamelinense TaxID=150831 RepID=A0A562THT1_9HYPH|nr:hypothetical protein [Roseibium hamelinense]MTI45613.1 hypothetical protein [Roseibium hamelinense]TWI93207.1 hypothetical protein JM93_00762 [Roseibium hamelinense]
MTARSAFRSRRLALLLGVSLLATPAAAFEPSGNAVADGFMTIFETDNGKVESYGTVTDNGGSVTITDLRLTNESDDNTSVYIASTTLEGGSVLDNGRMEIGQLDMGGFELTSDEVKMAVSKLSATDLKLPSPEEVKAGAENATMGPVYSSADIQTLIFEDEDGNKFDIGSITSSIDEMSGDLPTAGKFAINDITVTAENLDDEGKKALGDLGYDSMVVSVSGAGKWDPDAATMQINDLQVSGSEAGVVTLNLGLGGVTREVVSQLNETQDDPSKAMGIVQGVTVENISIKVDNESLVERVLDKQAKEAGEDREAYVAQLTGALPLMLAVLQNQEFQDKVSGAVTSFLENPINLTVTAAPAAPVPFPQIMGAAMMAPQTLPQVLGVDISANQ